MSIERSEMKNCAVIGLIIPIFLFISFGPTVSKVFADEENHYRAAVQLVRLVYDKQAMYEAAKKSALMTVKDRFENNPKTIKHAEVLTNLVLEVMDACFDDAQTQTAMRTALAKLYMEEFTEYELNELIKFFITPVGKKALQKLPLLTQKGWELGSKIGGQISSSPKYQQMLTDKIKELQEKGQLPQEFK